MKHPMEKKWKLVDHRDTQSLVLGHHMKKLMHKEMEAEGLKGPAHRGLGFGLLIRGLGFGSKGLGFRFGG